MRSHYVHNNKEYQISKYLLTKFIQSEVGFEATKGKYDIVHHVCMFFHNYFYVHENLYIYFKQKMIGHFEMSHSSPHEVHTFC